MKNTIAKLISVASGVLLVGFFVAGVFISIPTVKAADCSASCESVYATCTSDRVLCVDRGLQGQTACVSQEATCRSLKSSEFGSCMSSCQAAASAGTSSGSVADCKRLTIASCRADGNSVAACDEAAKTCDEPVAAASSTTTAAASGSTTGGTSGPVAIINPLGTTDPREFIGRIIRALMSVIGSLTLLMFIYGGVTWMTSMGDDKKVKKGKDIITYAILGLFVVAVAYVAVNAVIKGLSTGSAI